MESRGAWRLVVWLVALLVLAGCSPREAKPRNPTEDRLDRIGNAYLQACYNLERAPESVADIKPWLGEDFSPELLRSPNDGEEFVILWGVNFATLPPSRGSDPYTVGAYEKTGVRGQRYVLRFPRGVLQMTDAALKKANFPPGHHPPE